MKNLMVAEILEVSSQMKNDKQLDVVGDSALFIVTTKENTKNYPQEDFYVANETALSAYSNQLTNTKS